MSRLSVLDPRERASQSLVRSADFRTACIVGGASYEDQIGKLRRGAEIVVATPGRLLDCLRRSFAVLNQCNYIVLDEADRMIDLGFEPQVPPRPSARFEFWLGLTSLEALSLDGLPKQLRLLAVAEDRAVCRMYAPGSRLLLLGNVRASKRASASGAASAAQVMDVLAAMPSATLKPDADVDVLDTSRVYRTTYMFSATMPPPVERIAKRYLRRPVVVTIGSAGKAVDSVTQRVEWVERKAKPSALTRVLDNFQAGVRHMSGNDDGFKIIIFVNNRENSEDVHNQLVRMDRYAVALLHGGKSQEQREECIKAFRDGEIDVMIATDVAGRGIDVKDVGLVINYDMPHTIENYTHRIGRTGRAGRKGTAVTFLAPSDEKTFYDLKAFLETSKASVPHQLANHEASRIKPGGFETSKKDTTIFAQ